MNWKSFTEFFEGEGSISARVRHRRTRTYVVSFTIVIGQKWKPKLEQLETFLLSQQIEGAKIFNERFGYSLRIFNIHSISKMLKHMLPYAFMKKVQISTTLDYFDDKITGDELLRLFEKEYELGKRRTKPRHVILPYKRTDGIKASRLDALDLTRKKHNENFYQC